MDNLHRRINTSESAAAENLLNNHQYMHSYNRHVFACFQSKSPVQADGTTSRPEYYQPLMIIYLLYTTFCLWCFLLCAHLFCPQ